MVEKIVHNNQSIWDLALMYLGHPDGAKQLILLNPDKLNFFDRIKAGTRILVDESQIIDQDVVNNFKNKGYSSASTYKDPDWILETGTWDDEGIWKDTENWHDN